MTLTEKTHDYDPAGHLSSMFPAWWVTAADLSPDPRRGDHVVCWEARMIIFDPAKFCDDRDWALAHVAYHLEHHMHKLGHLTLADCQEADSVVEILLDRPESRPC